VRQRIMRHLRRGNPPLHISVNGAEWPSRNDEGRIEDLRYNSEELPVV
jgi:hypothetical protein